MATKNIARTAIEGGRTASYKRDRRNSLRRHRRATHMALAEMLRDPEAADDVAVPVRRPEDWDIKFADKLAAPTRWLIKKAIGKTFNEVQGLLLATFDTRSLAGRHLVFDHLMPSRDEDGSPRLRTRQLDYNFNADGVVAPGVHYTWRDKDTKNRKRANAWLRTLPAGVRIGCRDGDYFWFIPIDEFVAKRWTGGRYTRRTDVKPRRVYRQDRPLTAEELELYLALEGFTQRRLNVDKNPQTAKDANDAWLLTFWKKFD